MFLLIPQRDKTIMAENPLQLPKVRDGMIPKNWKQ